VTEWQWSVTDWQWSVTHWQWSVTNWQSSVTNWQWSVTDWQWSVTDWQWSVTDWQWSPANLQRKPEIGVSVFKTFAPSHLCVFALNVFCVVPRFVCFVYFVVHLIPRFAAMPFGN
jgi:hypothetical protein